MRTRIETLFVVAALLGAGAARARGQETAIDSRWIAYLGCWEPIEAATSRLCVVPVAGASAVDFVTVANGVVTARERIAATGERLETTRANCAGWRSAEWSSHGQRVYLRSADDCDGAGRVGTGLIAMSGSGQWLYIQSATVAGQTGLRVQGYREATRDVPLPSDVADALRLGGGVSATSEARAAAAAPLSIDDVIEASRSVEAAVLEAWLVERGEPFTLDAKRLVALADAGVPTPVIDLMVALSYPNVFAINAASRRGERRVVPTGGSRERTRAIAPISSLCRPSYVMYPYAPSYPYSPFDCPGWGYGWYPGGYPVEIVVIRPDGGSSRPHGRVVNGRGYRQGGSEGTPATPRPSFEPVPTSSGSSARASGPGSSSTSGSSEQRTAKPRP